MLRFPYADRSDLKDVYSLSVGEPSKGVLGVQGRLAGGGEESDRAN